MLGATGGPPTPRRGGLGERLRRRARQCSWGPEKAVRRHEEDKTLCGRAVASAPGACRSLRPGGDDPRLAQSAEPRASRRSAGGAGKADERRARSGQTPSSAAPSDPSSDPDPAPGLLRPGLGRAHLYWSNLAYTAHSAGSLS